MSAPWGDGKPERGYVYCQECDGEGVIYNNADPTSGQWVECECAKDIRITKALLEAASFALADLHDVRMVMGDTIPDPLNHSIGNRIKELRKAIAQTEVKP